MYLSRNPQGLVPLLETDEGDIIQSPAIMEYLEERYPTPALLPNGRLHRARVRAMAALVGCDIHPLNNRRVLEYLRGPLRQPAPAVDAWAAEWINTGFAALEAILASDERQSGFCFGSLPTLADAYLVPQVYSARRFGIDLGVYPRILEVVRKCEALPAFVQALPDHQLDALRTT